jgi:hypothetical protein
MSTLRVSNIEAKADASSPTINEKVKVTNSNGDVLLHLDGETSGITTVGINTTGNTFTVNENSGVTFSGIITSTGGFSGNLTGNVTGTVISSSGISTVNTLNVTTSIGIGTATPRAAIDAAEKTDAIALPQGTTAQRPTGNNPYIRYNTTNSALEFYNGTDWVEIISDYFPSGSVILG